MMHRADLPQTLVEGIRACKPDAIHLHHRASGFDQDNGKVTLHFEKHPSVTGDVLAGADGVHSRIRQALFGQDTPIFTGCVAWRGVVPGAHVIHYPLRGGERMNFVGIVGRNDWQVESWTDPACRSRAGDPLRDAIWRQ